MAINLLMGRNSPTESVLPVYNLVQKLLKTFEARFGSTNCKDLIQCDLGTDEGQEYFKNNNIREQCTGYTEEATRIAMSLIEEGLRVENL